MKIKRLSIELIILIPVVFLNTVSAGSFVTVAPTKKVTTTSTRPKTSTRQLTINPSKAGMSVLFLYTPEILQKMGSVSAIKTKLVAVISKANQIYSNNGLKFRINNAYLKPLPLDSDGQPIKNVGQVGSGAMNTVPKSSPVIYLRNKYYADFTVLVTKAKPVLYSEGSVVYSGFIAGTGFTVNGPASAYSTNKGYSAFSEIGIDANMPTILAHELGHNMGLNHSVDDVIRLYDYGHGYGVRFNFTTVMEDPKNYNTDRTIDFFSTPLRSYNGKKMGTNNINAERALNNSYYTFINYAEKCFLVAQPKAFPYCTSNAARNDPVLINYRPYVGIFPDEGMRDWQR